MRTINSFAIASSLALGLATPSFAATIVNGGFESPVLAPGSYVQYFNSQDIGGWTALGNNVLLIQTAYSEGNGIGNFAAQEGLNHLDITGLANPVLTNGVQQSISTNIGETYRLSFFVGVAKGNQYYQLPSILDLSIDGGARTSFTNANLVDGTVTWQQFSQDFTATNLSTTIAFFNGIASADNNFVGLDNVQISSLSQPTSVPEPFTIIGTLIGGSAALRMRKKLKAK
jgi:hypothetical protein